MRGRTVLLIGVLVGVAAAIAAWLILRAGPAQTTAAGTTIGGLRAEGMDRAGIVALMQRAAREAPASVRVELVGGSENVSLRREAVGLAVDAEATARKALTDSGKRRPWWFFGSSSGSDVAPVLTRDPEALAAAIARIQAAAKRPEQHGDLVYRRGGIEVVPPRDGREVDAQVVEKALLRATEQLPTPSSISVAPRTVPAHVAAEQLTPLADSARRLLGQPLTLQSGERRITVPLSSLGQQLTVVPDGEQPGHGVRLGLRSTAEQLLAEPAALALTRTPAEPNLAAPEPVALLSEKGDATWRPVPAAVRLTAPGQPGQLVTTSSVLALLDRHVSGGQPAMRPLVLPATRQPPRTTDGQARAINSVLGTFTTRFACCQPRVTNIRLIARRIDGTLIGPGRQFSLNGIVGPRTRAKGYVEAPFILEGELSKDIGGGVSQFATTTMNAAFFAGLPLNQFKPHSFYISRYPAGRESTVNYPSIDLRWTNNTGAAILVRASSTPTSVTVALYGRNDGRLVRAITGARRPVPGRDFRIAVVRELAVPGKPVQRTTYRTTYNEPPEDE